MEKIAILVLTHQDNSQLKQLINQFDSNKFSFFVHIDKKTNFNKKNYPTNVYFLEDKLRVNITWGHMSMVNAMINLLKTAYHFKEQYMFYWFVSGQDLAIKTSEEIYSHLIKNKKYNFVNFFDKKNTKKHRYRNQGYFPKWLIKRTIFSKIIRKIYAIILNGYANLTNKHYYFGSQWSVLNNDFVKYLLTDKESLNRHLKYFNKKIVPDESFFQTIIMKSPYKNNIKNNLTYIDWSEKNSSPKVFTMSDYEKLLSTDFFMARKFEEQTSAKVIKKILSEVK